MVQVSGLERTFERLGLMTLRTAGPLPEASTSVAGLAVDSRKVKDGFVFFAIPGTHLDGAEFAQFAIRQGAVGIVATLAGLAVIQSTVEEIEIPVFLTNEPRAKLAQTAAAFFGAQPDTVVAITGTNGKTSTAHFLRQIWEALGRRAVTFGTAGIEGAGMDIGPALTTPEPIALHALLAELEKKAVTHVAMEASSHGLSQHRLDGVELSAAALCNIQRDHLDYHSDVGAYINAKLRLFSEVLPKGRVAVLNADDAVFEQVVPLVRSRGSRVISVGTAASADLRVSASMFTVNGQQVTFQWAGRDYPTDLPLIGTFQAANAALAAGLAIATGEDPETVLCSLSSLKGVRGRMERAAMRQNGASVFVDYSHTPDALATAINALRPHCFGRLIVVFGAGGDRDKGKRPLMGRAVAERADVAIVTDDNPRSEDPQAIRAAILEAIPEADEIGDRAAAILAGVDMLKEPGDCLLIAGKGHEQGQEFANEIRPFDDAEQARASVAALDGMVDEFGGGR